MRNNQTQVRGRKRDAKRPSEAGTEMFPMFLKLAGRLCLVVGAGRIAEPKIESLVRCGARVRVVAPSATPNIRQAAQAGEIEWLARTFEPTDLDGAFLVVAATSSPGLHELIFRLAQQGAVLCNAVDQPNLCDFYYPAVVRRGPLQIAISTSGNSPSLARRIREELEQRFGESYGPWVKEIGKARRALIATGAVPKKRSARLKELSSERSFRRFRRSASPKRTARSGS